MRMMHQKTIICVCCVCTSSFTPYITLQAWYWKIESKIHSNVERNYFSAPLNSNIVISTSSQGIDVRDQVQSVNVFADNDMLVKILCSQYATVVKMSKAMPLSRWSGKEKQYHFVQSLFNGPNPILVFCLFDSWGFHLAFKQ